VCKVIKYIDFSLDFNTVSFRRHEKKGKERLEGEYKSKEVRLKAALKYKIQG
jgi:hypothetical protein